MFGSGILDLVIGLVFIYFIMSLISSAVREIFANMRDLRYRHLRDWFQNILKDDSFRDDIMKHHLIAGLTIKDKKPSYIPDNIFSTVVFDLFVSKWGKKEGQTENGDQKKPDGQPFNFEELKTAIENSNVLKDDLKRVVVQFAAESKNISHFRVRVETWFNQAMTEAGGAYKQRSQWWILVVAIIVTISLNVDSVAISKFLYENPDAREKFADMAAAAAKDSTYRESINLADFPTLMDSTIRPGDSILVNINVNVKEIKAFSELLTSSSLPIGWNDKTAVVAFSKGWWTRFFGWLMTALAVSMGAPFWFDLLNKLSNLRSSSKPPAERAGTMPADS
ncbi:MAG: hypothetical protein ACI8P3_002869 [Saprospiraceae bacterium]|jgi:hypothetical protein